MRRLIFVVVVIGVVRVVLAYRDRKLAAGEAELGLSD